MAKTKKWYGSLNPRNIPHPGYGNYCGAKRRCDSKNQTVCPSPDDKVDLVCVQHDINTGNPDEIFADWKLAGGMLKINPFNNSNYLRPVYGRVYQYGSALVMGLLGCITAPTRAITRLFKR